MGAEFPVAELVSGVLSLLLAAAGVYAICKRWHLPFTVMLVLAGWLIAQFAKYGPPSLHPLSKLQISPELILFIFLPTLIFESAFNLDSRQLRQNLLPVLALAVPGVLFSTALIGGLLWFVPPFDLPAALLLGAILSATDPVAVIALFKQLGAPKRLTVLVEGESLFNDATAIVLARILVGVAVVGYVTPNDIWHGFLSFFGVFLGGIVVGWVAALIIGTLLGKVESDAVLEVLLTVILAYLSFLVAEEVFHVSGVMATVAAGITMGGWGRTKISPSVSHYLTETWEYFGFLANALIFLIVGLQIHLPELAASLNLLSWVIVAMLLSRFAVVYGLIPLLSYFPNAQPVNLRYQTVIFWGGLRGAVALALTLSLPALPYSQTFVALVTGAVLFTLLAQGLSMESLVKYLRLDQPPLSDRLAQAESGLAMTQAAVARIPELQSGGLFSARVARALRQNYRRREKTWRERLEILHHQELSPAEHRNILFQRILISEKSIYYELFSKGHLSERVYRDLAYSVDLQIDNLSAHGRLPDYTLHSHLSRWLWKTIWRGLEWAAGFMGWLEHLSLSRTARDYEKTWGRYQTTSRVLHELIKLAKIGSIDQGVLQELHDTYQHWQKQASQRLDATAEQFPEFVSLMQERLAKRLLLHTQQEYVEERVHAGLLALGPASNLTQELTGELRALRGYATQALVVEPLELLRKVPFFQNLHLADFERIIKELHAHTAPPNEYIIHQGEMGDSLFLIARGVVRISRSENNVEQDLATLIAGDFFGEMALLHHEPRTATCRAVTPCALYELRREAFDRVRAVCPAIQAALEAADKGRSGQLQSGA